MTELEAALKATQELRDREVTVDGSATPVLGAIVIDTLEVVDTVSKIVEVRGVNFKMNNQTVLYIYHKEMFAPATDIQIKEFFENGVENVSA